MAELKIEIYNQAYVKCITDDLGLQQDLSDFFTFQVPGASFMPSVRARRWDGKIRLYSKATGKLYRGLIPYVEHFCENNRHTIILPDGYNRTGDVPRDDFSKFVDKILTKSLKIRDYQLNAFAHAINHRRCILLSPTASGKSLIIYCIIRMMTTLGKKSLLVVPTTSLVEQMYKDFEDYSWKAEDYVQRKYYGYDIDEMFVSFTNNLCNFDKKHLNVLIVSLVMKHLYKSKELQKIMVTSMLIVCTGTLDDIKYTNCIRGFIWAFAHVTTTKDLIDKKQLADLKYNVLLKP